MKWFVLTLLVLLTACVPTAQPTAKPAPSNVRLVINVDRNVSYQDALRNASQSFQDLGYTVLASDDSFRDYGLLYNDSTKADVDNAVRLASAARANYVVFIYSQPTIKDPPLLSGFIGYAEIKATVSIVDFSGKLVRRVEATGAGGTRNRSDNRSEIVIAAIPATMRAVALKVNEVINP
ncbi:MAG: hypothetical protein SFU83_22255 [Meiothermus sp.]|nr:hypothetical protein [Meiothermus sp.]